MMNRIIIQLGETMKIIDEPQFGPMFRFNDANVYWALYILSDGRRMGRKRLAEEAACAGS